MADQADNLVLEMTRAMRTEISKMRVDVGEVKRRFNELTSVVGGLRRGQYCDS